jgi:DNA-binding MarR family transcriptional regulator
MKTETIEHIFDTFFTPLEKARHWSVLLYIQSTSLDMGDKNSVESACDSLNLTKNQLTEIVEEFERDSLISIGNGFRGIEVKLTETGIAFIAQYRRN